MDIWMLFTLLGGLGLFLYGMKLMSDGLESVAGDKMRKILEMLTKKRLAAVGVGALVTAVIQSSSATTVMIVGFVNAGLMNLIQATGVIMGANIGTTITAQLIAFKLTDVAPFILFVGMIMANFVSKRKVKMVGVIILGFGMLFVGLNLMSDAMTPLREDAAFLNFLVNFKSPLVGVLIGALFTAIIQSSSASVGILQTMAGLGLIGFNSAIYVVLGQNIGTCITAILSAVGTSSNSKRAAGIHLLFNISGTVIFLIVLAIFPSLVNWIASLSPGNIARQIANFHTVFNVTVTIILIPLADQMVKLISIIIPDKHKKLVAERELVYLDSRIAQTPAIALTQTKKEIARMAKIANDNLRLAIDTFFAQDESKIPLILQNEGTVNYLNSEITDYLIQLPGDDLSDEDLHSLGMLHHVIIAVEHSGDRAKNIIEYTTTMIDSKESLTEPAIKELRNISDIALTMLDLSLDVFKTNDYSEIDRIMSMKKEIETLQRQYTDNHIMRLQEERCNPHAGIIFTNMLGSLERIAYNALNIACSCQYEE